MHESPSKDFTFKTNDVVLTKFGNDVYYAKIVSINYPKKTAMLLFDDGSKENQPFTNIFSVNETTSEIICIVCKEDNADSEDEIVLCDKCSIGFHQKCHKPKISSRVLSPDIPWECDFCERNLKNPYIQSNPFVESNPVEGMTESNDAPKIDKEKNDTKDIDRNDVLLNKNENEKLAEKVSIKTEIENSARSFVYTSPFEDFQKQKRCSKLDEILKDRFPKDHLIPLHCSHHDMVNNNASFEFNYADESIKQCKHSDLLKLTEPQRDLPTKMTAQVQPFSSSSTRLQTYSPKMTAQVPPFSLKVDDGPENNKTSFSTNNSEKNTKSSWLVQQLKKNGNHDNLNDDRKFSISIKEEPMAESQKCFSEPSHQSPPAQKNFSEGCSSTFENRESSLNNCDGQLLERCDVFKPKILIQNTSLNNFQENTSANGIKKIDEFKEPSSDLYHPPDKFDFKLHQDKYNEIHRGKTSIAPFVMPKYESLSRPSSDSLKSSLTLPSQHGNIPDNCHQSSGLSPKESAYNIAHRDLNKTLLSNPQLLNQSVSQLLCSPITSSPSNLDSNNFMNHRYQEALLEQRLAMYDKEIAKLKHQQQMLLTPQSSLVQSVLAKNHAILEMENQLQLAEAVRLKELINLRKSVHAMNPIMPQNMHIENLMFATNSQLNGLSTGSLGNLSSPVIMKNPVILNNQMHPGYVRSNPMFFNGDSPVSNFPLNELRARNEIMKNCNNHLSEREITALTIAEMRQKELNNIQTRSAALHPALMQINASENLFNMSQNLGGLDTNGNQLRQRELCRTSNALSSWLEKSSRDNRAYISDDVRSLKRFSQEDLSSDQTKKKNIPYRNESYENQLFRSGDFSASSHHDSTFLQSSNRNCFKQAEILPTSSPINRSSNVSSFTSPKNVKKQDKRFCHLCKNESQFICSACREAWYCSQKCQLADWKNHSKTCKTNGG